MANHKSAKKRVRQNLKRRERSKAQYSAVRTLIKKLHQTILAKNKSGAIALSTSIQSRLGKLASKGILKQKTAARYTSRLALKVASLAEK